MSFLRFHRALSVEQRNANSREFENAFLKNRKKLSPEQKTTFQSLRNKLFRLEKNINQLCYYLDNQDQKKLNELTQISRFIYGELASNLNQPQLFWHTQDLREQLNKDDSHESADRSRFNEICRRDLVYPEMATADKLTKITEKWADIKPTLIKNKCKNKSGSTANFIFHLLISAGAGFGVWTAATTLNSGVELLVKLQEPLIPLVALAVIAIGACCAFLCLISAYAMFVETRLLFDRQITEIDDDLASIQKILLQEMEEIEEKSEDQNDAISAKQ